MNIPSTNPNETLSNILEKSLQDPSLYSTSSTQESSAPNVVEFQKNLSSVYKKFGFGSSDSQSDPSLVPLLPSLEEPTGIMNPAQITAMLSELNSKQSVTDMNTSIGMQKDNMSNEHTAVKEQILADQTSMQNAAKAHKSSFWGKLFGWIGVAVLDIIAVAAAFVSFGAAAPLLVAAGMATTMMALQQTGVMSDITNGMAKLLEDMGVPQEVAQILSSVMVAVVTIAVTIAAVIASGGLAAGSLVADAADTAANTAVDATEDVTAQAQKVASAAAKAIELKANMLTAQIAFAITGAINGIGNGITGGVTSYFTYQELEDNASAQQWQAFVTQSQSLISTLQNQIKSMVQNIQANTDMATQAISSYSAAQDKVAQYSQV